MTMPDIRWAAYDCDHVQAISITQFAQSNGAQYPASPTSKQPLSGNHFAPVLCRSCFSFCMIFRCAF